MILATPVPWKRRGWALLWGLLLVHVFMVLSVACYIWNQSTDLGLLVLTPFWKTIVGSMKETLITQLGRVSLFLR